MRVFLVLIIIFLGACSDLPETAPNQTEMQPTKTIDPSRTPLQLTPTKAMTRGEELFAVKHTIDDFRFFYNGITVFNVVLEVGLPDTIYPTSGGFAEYFAWDLIGGNQAVMMVSADDGLIGWAWIEVEDGESISLYQFDKED